MYKVYEDYLKVDESTDNIHSKLIIPIQDISRKYFVHSDSIKYISLTNNAKTSFEEIIETKKQFGKKIMEWISAYKSMNQIVQQIIDLEFTTLLKKELLMEQKEK